MRVTPLPYNNCKQVEIGEEVYRVNGIGKVYWANDIGWLKIHSRIDKEFRFDGYDYYFIQLDKCPHTINIDGKHRWAIPYGEKARKCMYCGTKWV